MIEQRQPVEALRARLAAAACRANDSNGGSEYVGQENFMTADEILSVGRAVGGRSGGRVLDLCCGRGGTALYLAEEIGYEVVGLDLSPEAVMLAREAAALRGLNHRADFRIGDALSPPASLGTFDAVLVLETMLAFEDKGGLLREVRRLLRSGGRLGTTLEEGPPLLPEERSRSEETGDVWLTPEAEFLALLEEAGFRVLLREDHTSSHARVALRMAEALRRDRGLLAAAVGQEAYDGLISAHEQWSEWLDNRRVRKLVIVAEAISTGVTDAQSETTA